jgi:hypothetical protein
MSEIPFHPLAECGSNRLPVIEAEIRAEHEACNGAAQTSLEHAIRCGKLLIEAKDMLKHGQWLPWLHDNCGLSERTAQRCMRLARNAKSATVADLGVAAADKMLAASGSLPIDFDLSRGALGIDRINGKVISIEPCGGLSKQTGEPVYVGWCHIVVLTNGKGENHDGTCRRTLEGVHESEIVAWLREHGGVDVDTIEWLPGGREPEPDRYRAHKPTPE